MDKILLCHEKQHDFRNAIDSLKGFILKLHKDGRIDAHEKDVFYFHLGRLEKCSRLSGETKMKEGE